AGLDSTPMPRECVLDWFRSRVLPGDGVLARPVLLLATDVASEGLDLPLIERVVHYDLPWTSVRIDQRSGRAFRLGSTHPRVEVIRVPPPPALAEALRQELILQQKAALPARLGIDRGPSAPWRLRARVAAAWRDVEPAEGTAVTPGEVRGVVAGFRIRLDDGSHRALVAAKTAGGWTDDAETISGLLSAASGRQRIEAGRPEALRRVVHGLSARVRAALRLSHGAHLSAGTGRAARQLRHRVITLGREAARNRDRRSLPVIEHAVRFLRRGHTAGEEQRLRAWSALPDRDLLAVLAELPPEPDAPQPVQVALIGILMVEPGPPRR
ncbi:MAG TPA: helicase-related protein, partial [Gemmatimonadales bacterium]